MKHKIFSSGNKRYPFSVTKNAEKVKSRMNCAAHDIAAHDAGEVVLPGGQYHDMKYLYSELQMVYTRIQSSRDSVCYLPGPIYALARESANWYMMPHKNAFYLPHNK